MKGNNKHNNKHHAKKQPQTIVLALVLTGILSLSAGLTVMHSATAAPSNLSQTAASEMETGKSDRLPRTVANAVLSDLSRRVRIPSTKLKIIKYSRETWSDGCLGLSKPDELCTQVLVEGWRVVVSNSRQTWIYRTNGNGQNLRLEKQSDRAKLPPQSL
jgi:hypothetical protein